MRGVLKKEGQIKPIDKMVSQSKEGIDSLIKEQLPDQDCGFTNSGDGGSWDCIAVVGRSCGGDFQDEKRDDDCCDDLNGMF
ncbi:hypothetical protein BgiBS90_004576 [Biomphalaria glabrata]|nr:hypothetical protein BgiBS90_004576 [Biomphalaria glabrata]